MRCLDSVVAVVDTDNDTHGGNPPYYNRYKMENLKTNWKLPGKTKNPRSQQEIGCEEIENILKTAGFILFFLKKKCPLPCQIPERGRKSGHQVGKTALKWLDNTVKPCPKIGWWNLQFSTIQQRKKTVTSFSSQSYVWVWQKRHPVLKVKNQRCREILLFSFAEGPLQHPFQILCSCNFPRS